MFKWLKKFVPKKGKSLEDHYRDLHEWLEPNIPFLRDYLHKKRNNIKLTLSEDEKYNSLVGELQDFLILRNLDYLERHVRLVLGFDTYLERLIEDHPPVIKRNPFE